MIKTVIELDLVDFSKRARELQDQLGAKVVAQFQDHIQEFVDLGLAAVGLERGKVVKGTAGDNALLVFDAAAEAHRFAVAVHRACAAYNADKKDPAAQRWFRIGAATGDLEVEGSKIAGAVIIDAVRYEAAGRKGHILIDPSTYQALPKALRREYAAVETVHDKKGVAYTVHRCVVVEVPDEPKQSAVDEIYRLFDQLNPRDQLLRVMVKAGMPGKHRPANTLKLSDQQDQIVDWAQNEPDGLARLEKTLHSLIGREDRP